MGAQQSGQEHEGINNPRFCFMKKWFVYMLRCKGGSLYTGVTTDLDRRVAEHRSGKGVKYTRAHLPVELVWSESVSSESDAKKREAEIKKFRKSEKEELI